MKLREPGQRSFVKRFGLVVLWALLIAGMARSGTEPNLLSALARGLEPATDPDYGFTPEKPVMVGGDGNIMLGFHQVSLFLSLLRGPNGEKVKYERVGKFLYLSERDPLGEGEAGEYEAIGDFYSITYRGLAKPLRLAITMYDYDNPRVPQGLTLDEKEVKKLLKSVRVTPGED